MGYFLMEYKLSNGEKETMVVAIDNKLLVAEGIKCELKEALSWTTLDCDWGSVDVEIPYNLFFTSAESPWGYRYRVYAGDGTLVACNPLVRKDMNRILEDLISKFCRTKYGNRVDGYTTLYEFIPKSKRAYGR